ncbi:MULTISPECIES: branched-chain amino acid ABC transporter permease [unclassified Leptolyngbya]|uniref:branched-chain amino acid ABC transporter permease n=1 Tax=unclassified Leptolyngbya TaxID=2650499 RepID=UPI00168874E3|nr:MULTISPECIES: branched-chain amino acid ABC transporter permease [unclassified Leptolyngbya]MBD1910954.1 branched-chain amino acid ABC transporter permease [Leptolyngbya sp. FACHB-8]MBD2158380.1 branched-chain amino acid ABC transporter permease [Leptolyngbya sp. FACHB-16]
MENFIVSLVIFTTIFSIFALGLNLQWGFTGLINFGHVAFMTIGAYTTVLLSMAGVPLILAVVLGAIAASLLGLLIGFSTLRLREDYLAIVTIGVSEVIRLIAVNEDWLTKGTFGIQRFPLPLATLNLSLPLRIVMMAILTVVVGLAYWQVFKWLQQVRKHVPFQELWNGGRVALGYVLSLVLLLFGIGVIARYLNQSDAVAPWLLGVLLLSSLAGTVWLYVTLGERAAKRVAGWSAGLGVVMALIGSVIGIWVFGYGLTALYHYQDNPSKNGLMLLCVVLLALVYWGLERLVRSPWGRVIKAIREDEEVARALGKNVFGYKLQSLMLGGFLAGLAGALYSWQLTTVYPDNFRPLVTFNAWTMVVLGGAGSNLGTVLGATIFWAYDTITRFVLKDIIPLEDARLGAFRVMVIGFILIVLMMWRPQGMLGKKEELTLGR